MGGILLFQRGEKLETRREREDSQNLHYFSIANCAGSFVKYTGNFKCKCSRRKYQSCPCNNAQRECANGEFTVSFWFGKWAVKFVIIYIYSENGYNLSKFKKQKRKRLLEIKMWALPFLYPCGGECTTINVGNEMEKFFHFSFFFSRLFRFEICRDDASRRHSPVLSSIDRLENWEDSRGGEASISRCFIVFWPPVSASLTKFSSLSEATILE